MEWRPDEASITVSDVIWLGGIALGIWLGYDVLGPLLASG